MTRLIDGPAQGKTLMLTRAPTYLRVVIAADGTVDALNRPEDSPRADERLYAYLAHGERGSVHLNMGRGRGGFYALAEYKLIADQPSDETMRDTSLWRQWVVRHNARTTS
jgi:hypothetical protein